MARSFVTFVRVRIASVYKAQSALGIDLDRLVKIGDPLGCWAHLCPGISFAPASKGVSAFGIEFMPRCN